ncbi:uncharacterized protein LOC106154991 [Lingula anatina]|uniref:Uncharacterized protein LOC106154991 n=1 Tax=Lingula anatina TaxID=7574 RepID=A0A1S3HG49_LINAN|nr:uncharacterized protein LOC106154991 [Lingula anatina]|eukprot:XP_013385035.1 uncharacterized protein LOC106154991 [Lingula anatina]
MIKYESKLRNEVQPAESANSNPFQETTFKQEDYSSCTNKTDICSVDGQQNAQGCEQSDNTVDLPEASYQNPVQENIATVGKCPSKLVVSGNSDEELIANPLSNKGDVWQNVHEGINTPEKIINLSEQRRLTVDVTSDERAIFEHAGVEGGKYARADKKINCLSADLDHKPKKQPVFPIAPQIPASALVDSNCYSLFPTPTKIKRSSCALLANDETISTIYRTTSNIDTDLIRIISQTVSSISSVLRVTETLNNLKEFEIDLVPYLGIDFSMVTYASVEKVNFKNILDAEVIKACFESSNQVLKRYPCHSLLGKYTVRYTLYRGDAISMDVIASITVVETKQNILFWDWCLSNFNAETSYPPATKTKTIRPFKKNKRRKAKDKQDIHIPNARPQYLATLFEKCAQWLCGLAFVRTLVICCAVPFCSSTETQTTGQYFGQEVVLHEQSPTQVEDLPEAEQCVDSDFSSGEASAVTTGRESNSSLLSDFNLGRGAEGGSDLPVSTGFGHHRKITYGVNSDLHDFLDQESFYGNQNCGEAEGLVLDEGLHLNNGRYDENKDFVKEGQPHRGSYGEVSFGVDIQSRMSFAVKRIPIRKFNRREPRILSIFNHPNIIKLYGLIRRGNCIEIIMEKATNGTWLEMINSGPVQEQKTLQCLMGALTGLEQLHRCSFIHRDLKPDNIGMMADGRVVILDLGSVITPADTQDFEEEDTRDAPRPGVGSTKPLTFNFVSKVRRRPNDSLESLIACMHLVSVSCVKYTNK